MPDLGDKHGGRYGYLDQLSTQELYHLLERDFQTRGPDSPVNEEYLERILEVMISRQQEGAEVSFRDTDEALEEFDAYYRPAPGERADSPQESGEDGDGSSHDEDRADSSPTPKRAGHRALRTLAAAAVICALLLGVAGAFQWNLFEMIGNWTQDYFQFRSEKAPDASIQLPQTSVPQTYTSLTQALEANGMDVRAEPSYLPEGYQFVEAEFYNGDNPIIAALYEYEHTTQIIITVMEKKTAQADGQEKDKAPVRMVTVDGIEHYIMENNGQLLATWFAGNYECTIRGIISVDEMEAMIYSIY